MGDVRDWAPPGWHWEVISEARRLVRNPGPVVDPDLLWWRSRGPQSVRRQPAPRVDCTPTCQGGGRARPSLLGGVGRRVMEDLEGSSGISSELRVRGGSFSLGGHLSPHPTLFTVLVMLFTIVLLDIYV